MDTHSNLLLCGYLRSHEKLNKIIIPTVILDTIHSFSSGYLIFGFGKNRCKQFGECDINNNIYKLTQLSTLTSNPQNIICNNEIISVITSTNELYVAGNNTSKTYTKSQLLKPSKKHIC